MDPQRPQLLWPVSHKSCCQHRLVTSKNGSTFPSCTTHRTAMRRQHRGYTISLLTVVGLLIGGFHFVSGSLTLSLEVCTQSCYVLELFRVQEWSWVVLLGCLVGGCGQRSLALVCTKRHFPFFKSSGKNCETRQNKYVIFQILLQLALGL